MAASIFIERHMRPYGRRLYNPTLDELMQPGCSTITWPPDFHKPNRCSRLRVHGVHQLCCSFREF